MSSNMDAIKTNTTNYILQKALETISGKILGYLNNPYHHDFSFIKEPIDRYIDQFGKEFIDRCDYLFNEINKYGQITPSLFLLKIDNVIETLLSYDIKIYDGGYKLGYAIGHYKLIEKAFQNNIKPGWPESYELYLPYILQSTHPLTFVINSHRSDEEIIKIIKLFCQYGYNMNNYDGDFITSCKVDVIKYIIDNIDKHNFLNDMIHYLRYNEASLEDYIMTIKYIVVKTKTDYGVSALQTALNRVWADSYNIGDSLIIEKYKHIIRELIINGADINLQEKYDIRFDRFHMINIRRRELYTYISDLIITNDKAKKFVKDVSMFVLPDIANIVFDYSFCYTFSEQNI